MNEQDKNTLKYVGIAAAALFTFYVVFGKKMENGNGGEDPTGNNGYTPTSPPFNATKTALALYDAMSEIGTKDAAILEILKFVNQKQFADVVKYFGRRAYNSVLGNNINFNPFGGLPLVDLKGWFKSELNEQDYEILRKKYPNSL